MRSCLLALLFWFSLTQSVAVPGATSPVPPSVDGIVFIGGFLTKSECDAVRDMILARIHNGRGGWSLSVCYQSDNTPQAPPGP